MCHGAPMRIGLITNRPAPDAYLIAAKTSTCSRKFELDNCGAWTVSLSGPGWPRVVMTKGHWSALSSTSNYSRSADPAIGQSWWGGLQSCRFSCVMLDAGPVWWEVTPSSAWSSPRG